MFSTSFSKLQFLVLIWNFLLKHWLFQSWTTYPQCYMNCSCTTDQGFSFSDYHYWCFGGFNCCFYYGLCHDMFSLLFFNSSSEIAVHECAWFLFYSLPSLKLLSFYFWQHVKCYLHWRMITSLIMCKFAIHFICLVWCIGMCYICTRVYLYNIVVCTCGTNIYMWLLYWILFMWCVIGWMFIICGLGLCR